MSEFVLEIKKQARVLIEAKGLESICTDAPKEHGGVGEYMSPTDLLASALGSCVLTIMSLFAKPLKVDLQGTKALVVKEQGSTKPGYIGILEVHIYCPQDFDETIKKKLEAAAKNCPIHHSLDESIKQSLIFHWGESLNP